MKKKLLTTLLLLTVLLISSCNQWGTNNPGQPPEVAQYYQGSEGIRMTISPGAPPNRLYYYSDLPQQENIFDIEVELHNVGASYTRGGFYISGYDPTLITIPGMDPSAQSAQWWEDCNLGLNLGGSVWGGNVNCNLGDRAFSGALNSDGEWQANINNIFQLLGIENAPELDINYDSSTHEGGFNLDISGLIMDGYFEGYHGLGLLALIGGLKFDRLNGRKFNLHPDNYDLPGGESEILSFEGFIKDSWPTGFDQTDATFLFTSCYAYATYATPTICVDPVPLSEHEKVCYPGQVDLKSSQGAPVAVTRVLQENTPRSIIFTIEVQNVGRGKIIDPGYLELCSPYYPGRLSIQHTDVVYLGDIRLSGSNQRLKCSPDDYKVRLRDGRGQITCRYDLEYATAKSAYKAPLIVELWYGYSETERRNVHIKRVS